MNFDKLAEIIRSIEPVYLFGTNIRVLVTSYKCEFDEYGMDRAICEVRALESEAHNRDKLIDYLRNKAHDIREYNNTMHHQLSIRGNHIIQQGTPEIVATIDGKWLCDIPYGTEAARILYG